MAIFIFWSKTKNSAKESTERRLKYSNLYITFSKLLVYYIRNSSTWSYFKLIIFFVTYDFELGRKTVWPTKWLKWKFVTLHTKCSNQSAFCFFSLSLALALLFSFFFSLAPPPLSLALHLIQFFKWLQYFLQEKNHLV